MNPAGFPLKPSNLPPSMKLHNDQVYIPLSIHALSIHGVLTISKWDTANTHKPLIRRDLLQYIQSNSKTKLPIKPLHENVEVLYSNVTLTEGITLPIKDVRTNTVINEVEFAIVNSLPWPILLDQIVGIKLGLGAIYVANTTNHQ